MIVLILKIRQSNMYKCTLNLYIRQTKRKNRLLSKLARELQNFINKKKLVYSKIVSFSTTLENNLIKFHSNKKQKRKEKKENENDGR